MKTVRIMSIVCLLLSIFLSLAACGGKSDGTASTNSTANVSDSKQPKIIDYISKGEYQNAIVEFNSHIAGDYSREEEAAEAINQFLKRTEDSVCNGEIGADEAEKVVTVVERVILGTGIYVDDFEQRKENIEAYIKSKAAYTAGKELEQRGNYSAAIDEYKKVLREDSSYYDAEDAIGRCMTALKNEAFNAAEDHANKSEYAEAIKLLKELQERYPDDSDILSKITVYEKTYISNTIKEAKNSFVTPDNYETALTVINSALQQIPGNEELIKEKEYYLLFQPVNLYDIDPFAGELYKIGSDKDSRGNEYTNCFMIGVNSKAKYELGTKYNKLTMTIYGRDDGINAVYETVEIYGDGKLLYSNKRVATNGKAFDIEIDVTGVDELQIDASAPSSLFNRGYGLTDVVLKRTEK